MEISILPATHPIIADRLRVARGSSGRPARHKRFFSGTPGVVPGYFLFLVATALVPNMFLFPTVLPFINWRALSLTYFLL